MYFWDVKELRLFHYSFSPLVVHVIALAVSNMADKFDCISMVNFDPDENRYSLLTTV